MLVNVRSVRIEWGDCDPMGIIFYPRYFAIFDACTTALIERALGMGKHDYLQFYGITGHPVVKNHARFLIPTHFGDEVEIDSTPTRVGRSSIDVRHRLTKNGMLAVEGSETRVWVRGHAVSGGMKSAPMPPELVERLLQG
jgi:4-hydroxybenzoyl-CoA thioesterase